MANQNPEQLARDAIDRMLLAAGWQVQPKQKINLAAATSVAVREYQTDVGSAEYVLFVVKKPVGIIEAKRAEERMSALHKDLTTIGTPLVNYGATPERLATFASLIAQFTKLKPAGQVLVTTRKGHNSTVPQLMSSLRAAFRVLDDVIPQWEDDHPEFVRNYQNAREVKDTSNRGGGDDDEKKPEA